MTWTIRRATSVAFLTTTLLAGGMMAAPPARAALPPGFQVTNVFSGLDLPTAVRFSPDGRVFVAEKSGIIKVFDSLTDTTPTVFADLSTNVYNFFDRGLLGLELDPNFPTSPYVYVLYTYDGDIGGPAPKWGTPGVLSDPCPDPPGGSPDGCVASARLSRLRAAGDVMTGTEQVLIHDWCQQGPTHSIGTVTFGPDGALYVGAGDAAVVLDWGQYGYPVTNPCGDPPGGVGGTMQPPTAQGGALRSQDLRTPSDPTTLDGTIIRVDPATGAALPGNPLFSTGNDENARRIVAHGLRNPFRFTFRPGTSEIWIGDVGENVWEEIDRIPNPTGTTVPNFGWPCYEGAPRAPGWDSRDFTICEDLYSQPPQSAATGPFFAYRHGQPVYGGDPCPTGSSAITGMQFYRSGSYPAAYNGALFFADYGRHCIWVMRTNQNGQPDPSLLSVFMTQAGIPVDLQVGPGGDLFYVDIAAGRVRRIQYVGGSNQPPTAAIQASPTSGPAPLTVSFDGSGSSDPEGGTLSYSWDLNGDGVFGDATTAQTSYTYQQNGNYTVQLRVTDPAGGQDTASVVVSVGNTAPTATILQPSGTFTWHVGETISFSGSGTDPEEGTLPASALSWDVILHHCPIDCHEHFYESFAGQASGSFPAPDHEYPAHLEIRLTVTDSGGLQDTESVLIYPETVSLTVDSSPPNLQVALNNQVASAPVTGTVIVGSTNSVTAPSPQSVGGTTYTFSSWSDGGAQSHDVVAGTSPATYVATYTATSGPAPAEVSITDSGFTPNAVTVVQGQAVRWTNNGPSNHTVTDNSGMGYFNSGTLSPGSTYQFTFTGAGRYVYRCTLTPSMGASVSVPLVVSPTSGTTATSFRVTWASAAPPAGYVFDLQVRRPGSTSWSTWLTGQTATGASFTPDAGTGTYSFRARLRNTANDRASQYSPPASVSVSGSSNQPPTAAIQASPTSGPAPLTVSFDGSGSSDPEGGTLSYSWDLNGDGVFGDAITSQTSYTYQQNGNYTVQLRVTDPAGGQGTASVVISVGTAPAPAEVSITDSGFTPNAVTVVQGQAVRWTNNGPSNHTVTDNSGMGYFNSGTLSPGSTYQFTFTGAGRYVYRCTLTPSLGASVSVPLVVSPTSGTTATSFRVTWASAAPPAGYVFDLQVRRPGSTSWSTWLTGQTATGASFTPDAGTGTYSFRARLRNTANDRASQYSPIADIRVS